MDKRDFLSVDDLSNDELRMLIERCREDQEEAVLGLVGAGGEAGRSDLREAIHAHARFVRGRDQCDGW